MNNTKNISENQQVTPQGGSPEPSPNPPTRTVEFLTAPPKVMTKPLALIDRRAYAATWVWVRVTEHGTSGSESHVAQTNVHRKEVLCIVRDDGYVFSEDFQPGDTVWGGFHALKMTPKLPDKPHASHLWSQHGVERYREGARPEPMHVFERIVDVVDCFISFDGSLAEQQTMCEMVACYVLSTWFLDSFDVIGYLWPLGGPGCGKTQLLTVVAELSYLGKVILAGSSFASLRNLADYGATLCFDDAESFTAQNSHKLDPNKMNLILAGNRKGNVATVMEPGPSGTWHMRHVNSFSARCFSSTQPPYPTLASRSIIVPLRRTADRAKMNADPGKYALWPHERKQLVDDLWALALAHLPVLQDYEAAVNQQATLIGRNLEPWRPLLAIAKWLNDQGVEGLWERLEALSQSYQAEREELEPLNQTTLVIHALLHAWATWAASATNATSASGEEQDLVWDVTAEMVRGWCEQYIDEYGVEGVWGLTNDKVGRELSKLRFKPSPRPGGKGSRQRAVPLRELCNQATAYGIPIPEILRDFLAQGDGPGEKVACLSISGTSGSSGSSGTIDWDTFDVPIAWDEIPTD